MENLSNRYSVNITDRKSFIAGCCLVVFSLFMPHFFTAQGFKIMESVAYALSFWDRLELISGGLRLVILNVIRAIPHYLGAFLIAESLSVSRNKRQMILVNAILVFIILRLTYMAIYWIYGVEYDFGLTSIIVIILLIVFKWMDFRYISPYKKFGLIIMGIITTFFLDIMPAVDGLGIGRGELSTYIKLGARVLECDNALNVATVMGFLIFLVFSVVFALLIAHENNLLELEDLRRNNQQIQDKVRLEELQNRTYQEMQHLVHDIKSPLTVTQTLLDVLRFRHFDEADDSEKEIFNRMDKSIDRVNRMVSEILYEKTFSPVSLESLINNVMSQLSIESYASKISIETQNPEDEIIVNSILFSRALVNIVFNGAKAIEGRESGRILVSSYRESPVEICILVEDNGRGIARDKLEKIWDRGYSESGSSGLGLTFAKRIVSESGGSIEVESREGEYTRVFVRMPLREGMQ